MKGCKLAKNIKKFQISKKFDFFVMKFATQYISYCNSIEIFLICLLFAGKLFHIDFGYILGRDPKVLPPPMKLSKEMIEAMGGTNSDHFHDFKKLCYTSFLALRR